MKKHSDFSPSSFERRYLCPASYLMEKDLPNTTSKYAEVGTICHELVTIDIKDYLSLLNNELSNEITLQNFLYHLTNFRHLENTSKQLLVYYVLLSMVVEVLGLGRDQSADRRPK